MTVINTNTAATLTANALSSNQRAMNQTMERLSTGSRINSASDDAAGLAMVSKMDAQVRGTNMAIRNANDAISMIQTADGAAIEIDSMLQRMRELAVQSKNETLTTDDLTNLNKEFADLATEIERVALTTEFNDTLILNGSGGGASDGKFDFNIGANSIAASTMEVDFSDFRMNGGVAVPGVQTATLATDDTGLTGGADGDSMVVQFTDGTYFTILDTDFSGAGATGGEDPTAAHFLTAFEAANSRAAAGNAHGITATRNGTTFTFTQDTAGSGVIKSITRQSATGVDSDITNFTDGDFTLTTEGTVVNAGGVMADNLSAFTTAKVGAAGEAQKAATIGQLDDAIAGLASQRATFGAAINRLEYTIDNLANISQNTVASRSRIEDADYAAETTELARTQIISQAATAMLSQANQQAQSVLALLK